MKNPNFSTAQTPGLWAIIPAAGQGARFGAAQPKQYLQLQTGHTILWHTVHQLLTHDAIGHVMLALNSEDTYWEQSDVARELNWSVHTTLGGRHRSESVWNGLKAIASQVDANDWVLVHDACRPCISHADLTCLIQSVEGHAVGGLLALPSTDTLKRVDAAGDVVSTVDRSVIWRAQTPQIFRYGLLCDALAHALRLQQMVTDESNAVELLGKRPSIIPGSGDNIKITHPQDLQQVELILAKRG